MKKSAITNSPGEKIPAWKRLIPRASRGNLFKAASYLRPRAATAGPEASSSDAPFAGTTRQSLAARSVGDLPATSYSQYSKSSYLASVGASPTPSLMDLYVPTPPLSFLSLPEGSGQGPAPGVRPGSSGAGALRRSPAQSSQRHSLAQTAPSALGEVELRGQVRAASPEPMGLLLCTGAAQDTQALPHSESVQSWAQSVASSRRSEHGDSFATDYPAFQYDETVWFRRASTIFRQSQDNSGVAQIDVAAYRLSRMSLDSYFEQAPQRYSAGHTSMRRSLEDGAQAFVAARASVTLSDELLPLQFHHWLHSLRHSDFTELPAALWQDNLLLVSASSCLEEVVATVEREDLCSLFTVNDQDFSGQKQLSARELQKTFAVAHTASVLSSRPSVVFISHLDRLLACDEAMGDVLQQWLQADAQRTQRVFLAAHAAHTGSIEPRLRCYFPCIVYATHRA